MRPRRGAAACLLAVLIATVLLVGWAPRVSAVSVTVPYSATPVADADLDGYPATGSWGDTVSASVPLENGDTSGYGSATLRAKHDGIYAYFRIDGLIDVAWTSTLGSYFWLGMQISPTGTSHHGGGTWDGIYFGLWDATKGEYSPAPTYPPSPVDTNGFSKPPSKDTSQDDLGKMRYSGSAAPYSFTAEWKKKLNTGDSSDLAVSADGATTYNFFMVTDSNGGGSNGGSLDHNKVTNSNVLRFSAPPAPTIHDVAVTTAGASPTSVLQGQAVTVSATVSNQGTQSETFGTSAYAGTFLIGTQTVTNLAAATSQGLSFIWDTTGVAFGAYPIRVEAAAVTGETDLADNALTDGTVTVSEPQAMSMTLASNRREMMSNEVARIHVGLVSGSTPVTTATVTASTPLGGTFSSVRNLGSGNYEVDWTAPIVTRQTFAPVTVVAKAPGYLDTSGRVVILVDPNKTNPTDPTQLFLLVRSPATSLAAGTSVTITVYVYTIEGYVVSGATLTLLRVGPGALTAVSDKLNGEYTLTYTAPSSVPSPTGVLITITASKFGYANGTARLALTVLP